MTIPPDPQHENAIIRILKAVARLPAEVTVYAATLSSLALMVGNTDPATLPPALATFAGGIGVNLLANLIERLARGEALTDEQIAQTVQVALDATPLRDALTHDQFRADLARLAGGLNLRLLKQVVEQGDRALAARLTDLYGQYDLLQTESRTGFEQVNARLDDLRQALDRPAPQVQQTIEGMTGGTVIGIQHNYQSPPTDPRVLEALARLEALLSPKPPETFEPEAAQHVFISYSRKDTAFVERLERDLNARGILLWRDQHSIPGGAEWFRAIKSALETSYAMLYIDTPAAESSRWVEKEYLYAEHLDLPIIPIRIEEQFVSLRGINLNPILCDALHYQTGIARIAAALASITDRRPPPPVTSSPPMENLVADTRDYLQWLLLQSRADLRDALYVNLLATPQRQQAAPVSSLSSGLEDDFVFERVGVERIHGEDFDKAGEEVPDARIPIQELRRVILLGDPGAGKTTTLLQLAVDCARAAQQDTTTQLPVYIPLRQFTGETSFEQFIRAQLYTLQNQYRSLIAQDRLLLLCDALNEMPRRGPDDRDLVAEIQTYLADKPHWVVSCRVTDYQADLQALHGVSKVQLRPLDPPRIEAVIQRRFADSPETGSALWQSIGGSDLLLSAWEKMRGQGESEHFWHGHGFPSYTTGSEDAAWQKMRADQRRIMPLCRNPYMLRMICHLFEQEQQLPDNRGNLFGDFVTNLLRREERACQQIGAAWLDQSLIRQGLTQIAYTLGAETEMPRDQAEDLLQQHLPGSDHRLLLRLAQAASLIEIGQTVRFTHQLLQEYFASERMGHLLDTGQSPLDFWPPATWWQPTGREVSLIILAGVRGDPEGVARWAAPAQPELAYRVLTESGVPLDLNALTPETRAALVESAQAKRSEQHPVGRATAYRVLGLLNADSRPGIGLDAHGLPDIDWVDIPAGEFIYGDQSEDNGPINLYLPAYCISRYPITYAQFQAFVEADDYDDDRWWAGMPEEAQDFLGTTYRTREMSEQAFRYANHPRERVSWYQAVAFCRWLSDKLGYEVRLPTEQEWEKAARGTEGREYPYEGAYDAAKGNTSETGIEQTSAVGIFSDGASPYGVLDMSGNLWEWCLNKYDTPEVVAPDDSRDTRVLRGGSFDYYRSRARAVFRSNDLPSGRRFDLGFRLVRPPSS